MDGSVKFSYLFQTFQNKFTIKYFYSIFFIKKFQRIIIIIAIKCDYCSYCKDIKMHNVDILKVKVLVVASMEMH